MNGSIKPIQDNSFIIFTHIPKTAGWTIRRVLEDIYGDDRILEIKPDPGNIGKGLFTFHDFQYWPDNKKNEYKVLLGHIRYWYGLHLYMPKNNQNYSYITVLRNPVERSISDYYYTLGRQRELFDRDKIPGCNNIIDWLKKYPVVNNIQTRFLSSFHEWEAKIPDWAFESAKWNLENRFAAVGILERLEDTFKIFQNTFDWDHIPSYGRENTTPIRPKRKDVDEHTLNAIKELNSLDIELYRYALELLDQRLEQII